MTVDHELYLKIHDFVTAQLQDELADDEVRELTQLVTSDHNAGRIYAAYVQDCASLQWILVNDLCGLPEFGDLTEQSLARVPSSRTAVRTVILYVATIAASLLCLSAWFLTAKRSRPETDVIAAQPALPPEATAAGGMRQPASPPSEYVATISGFYDVRFSPDKPTFGAFSRIKVGQMLSMESGQIEVTFDSGAQVQLLGPVTFEVTSATTARCLRGYFTAEVAEQGKGFSIDTPSAKVVDLGTRFGVGIDAKGSTEVVVFEGVVDLNSAARRESSSNTSKRLTRGEALRVNLDGEFQRVVAIDRDAFPALRQRRTAAMPPAVIADVHDNIRGTESRKCYQIVPGGLTEDAPAFVDRDHQWNGVDGKGIPSELLGADYVMPFNDDKFVNRLEVLLRFRRSATLYVLLSESVTPPGWLTSTFTNTGLHIGLDEGRSRYKKLTTDIGPGKSVDTRFSIWKRHVSIDETITLGALERPNPLEGYNMYGIAAVATD